MLRGTFIWSIIILAVIINFYDLISPLFIFENLRYGHFLAKRLFLVVVAFGIAGFWLTEQKGLLKSVKQNLAQILLIGLVLLVAHLLSFTRWFYFDDFRILSHHVAAQDLHSLACCGPGYFPIAIFHLMIPLFNINYELYNAFGLFIYFLIGIVIFALVKQFYKKNLTALLIAIFFVTSPTYFHETLAMNEFMSNGFALLLFVISAYLSFVRFWPGVVIFSAAALELGLSRTHSIPILLTLIIWLFSDSTKRDKVYMIIVSVILFLLALPYRNVLFGLDTFSKGLRLPEFDTLLIYPDMIFGVIVPHEISYPLIHLLRLPFGNFTYLSTLLGVLIVISLVALTIKLLKQKKLLPAKLIVIGLVIILASLALPSMTGSRVERNLGALTLQYTGADPVRATSYGVFPTFGMVLILSGVAFLISYKKFKLMIISIIILNSLTLIFADGVWAKNQSYTLKTLTFQFKEIMSSDGKIKIIHIPPRTRQLWDSLNTFQGLYRPKEKFIITGGDRQEFMDLLNEYKLPPDQLYFFKIDQRATKVIDISPEVRPYYPKEVTKLMEKLEW